MTKAEIREILAAALEPQWEELEIPTEEDWRHLESKFSTQFPDEFRSLVELVVEFRFPELLDVPAEWVELNDCIEVTYDLEIGYGLDPDLIPFFEIGNGDYHCLSAAAGKNSPVLSYDHEDQSTTVDSPTVAEWIARLPAFLAGEL